MGKTQENWEKCLQWIKKHVSAQAFETWFASIELINIEEQQITLQVPNRFHYEWLESKYGDLLARGFKSTFGGEFEINYSVLITTSAATKNYAEENIKKIEVYRQSLGKPLLANKDRNVIAIASDVKSIENTDITILPLNKPEKIAQYILKLLLSSK